MIIKSISLYNFRQYKGIQTVEFSCDPEKNVTVILGKNTSGKTTLVQAFNWCLYEKSNFKSKEILNVDIADAMNEGNFIEVYVEITLQHENNEYVVRRTQQFDKSIYGKINSKKSSLNLQYKDESGSTQEIQPNQCTNTLNKILPEALSDYFFFDGERIGEINNKGDVVSAVRALMGLDVVSEAKDIFDPKKAASVTTKFSNALDIGASQQTINLHKTLEIEQENLEKIERKIISNNEELDFLERRKRELTEILDGSKEIQGFQIKKGELEKDLNHIEKEIEEAAKQVKYQFGANSMNFFAKPLLRKAIAVIDEAKTDDEGIPHMRAKAIDHILKRGRCICGKELEGDKDATEHIRFEKSLLPPQHIGTILGNYKKTFKRYDTESNDFHSQLMSFYSTLNRNKKMLDSKTIDLNNISQKIIENGSVNVGQIQIDYRENEKLLREQVTKEINLARSKGEVESTLKGLENQIERLAISNKKNVRILKSLEYSKAIYDLFATKYESEEKEVKEKLLASVNRIFNKMYHGERIVNLDDRYHINLQTVVGNTNITTDESKGLEAVKNFSFITGLVDLAREKARGTVDEDMISAEPYPLVMDAPFSNVDELHIHNIATILPQCAEQVILIVMNKDWEHAKSPLHNKIGAMYTIDKVNNSDSHSRIERESYV